MKILCISLTDHPGIISGVSTFTRRLEKIFNKEELIYLAYATSQKKYFKVNNIIEYKKDKNFIFKILYKLFGSKNLLKWKVRKINPDIAILQAPGELKILLNNKCKKTLVQHMSYDKEISNFFYNNNPDIINMVKKEVDCFVFLSDYDKDKFIKEMDWKLEKSKVIRHSCEIELLKGKKEKNKNLIMICRIDNNQKRIDLAIKAMKKLPNYNLKIYGDGVDRIWLEEMAKKENVNNVFFMGETSQIKEKLDEGSIFIMTSDYEGYPITSIEAMRRGLPIVLRNTFDSAQDIIKDNGILLEKEWIEDKFVEAVRKIYNNYEFYSNNAVEMGKRYDFEIIQKEWKELVNNLYERKNI